jgi:hypothetical protein
MPEKINGFDIIFSGVIILFCVFLGYEKEQIILSLITLIFFVILFTIFRVPALLPELLNNNFNTLRTILIQLKYPHLIFGATVGLSIAIEQYYIASIAITCLTIAWVHFLITFEPYEKRLSRRSRHYLLRDL